MSHIRNPFAKSTALPGHGEVTVSRLPPSTQALTQFTYQYPLKLITPDPHKVLVQPTVNTNNDQPSKEVAVTTIFLLTYGGGLLAQDSIKLNLTLESYTRVALLTQGSTKIFKSSRDTANHVRSATPDNPTSQVLDVTLTPHSSLCYLPDPNQPFADSIYVQRQTFYVDPAGSSSLLLLDWVSEGRKARGESWTLSSWRGRNEVRELSSETSSSSNNSNKGRLLIRDALILENGRGGDHENLGGQDLTTKTNGLGVLGTLIVYGPMWKTLAASLMAEFQSLPRIGAQSWRGDPTTTDEEKEDLARTARQKADGLLWTAAQVRGFVLLKFGAKDLDAARRWLCEMLRKEGSVEREFGHQALLCLK